MEWVILQPLHFRNLHFGRFLWANDLPSYHQKIQVASGAGQDTWKTRFGGSGTNDECYMAGQEWGFPCLPLQPMQKKTGYSILQLLTMVKKKWSHIITHTLCICRCVCVCVQSASIAGADCRVSAWQGSISWKFLEHIGKQTQCWSIWHPLCNIL